MTNSLDILENDSKQYIVVKIGSEQYGIDIRYIDNIVRMQKITRVPKAQSYFKGVINLRGEIVPVMSIRLKMGLEIDQFTNASIFKTFIMHFFKFTHKFFKAIHNFIIHHFCKLLTAS